MVELANVFFVAKWIFNSMDFMWIHQFLCQLTKLFVSSLWIIINEIEIMIPLNCKKGLEVEVLVYK